MTLLKAQAGNVRWRSVALPTEHGGWSFISEPILLGLLLSPSWGGLALGITALAAFLLRQPLKLYLKDVRNGRHVPRTEAARKFVMLYGSIVAAGGIATLLLIPSIDALLPLILALPFMTAQLLADVQNRSRALLAELAGATATGAIASAIVLMGQWSFIPAFGLWLALAVKAVTAVLYVRARLRLERDKPSANRAAVLAHLIGLATLMTAAAYKVVVWTAVPGIGILLLRAFVGLSPLRKNRPPKIIGMQEIGYGVGFMLLIVVGSAIR